MRLKSVSEAPFRMNVGWQLGVLDGEVVVLDEDEVTVAVFKHEQADVI